MKMHFRILSAAAIALLAAVVVFQGKTLANWSVSVSRSGWEIANEVGAASLSVAGLNDQNVSEKDLDLEVSFTVADATAIRALSVDSISQGGDGQVVWGKLLTIRGTTHGSMGMGYSLILPQTTPSGYAQGMVLFPVADPSRCPTTGAAGADWPALPTSQPTDLSVPVAIDSAYKDSASYSQSYCLATIFAPTQFANEAKAEVNWAGNIFNAFDVWTGFVMPNMNTQLDLVYVFRVSFFCG
jgi:hypothetical protein